MTARAKSGWFVTTVTLVSALVVAPRFVSAEWPFPSQRSQARGIMDATGIKGGLVVHVGCGDGHLTAALHANDRYLVHGLDADPANIETARTHIRSLGLYGKVSVDLFDGRRMPYTDNLVNLVVAERLGEVPIAEVMRVLAPGGVAYVASDGKWTKTVKPWPKEIDQWTHHCHGPDGNPVAQDRVVGPPKQLQWIAGPKWLRAHDTDSSIAALVTAGGRIFYMVDEAPISLPGDNGLPDRWSLAARDAFNGVLLWNIPVHEWGWRQWKDTWFKSRNDNFPINLHRRVVAVGDRVYTTLGYRARVSQLDAATGEIVRRYDGTEGTREIIFQNDQLILTVPGREGIKVVVLDPITGNVVWETDDVYAGTSTERHKLKVELDPVLNAAADDDVVCFMDGQHVVCLDRDTGTTRWRTLPESKSPALWAGTLIVNNGVILCAQPLMLTALSADDGRKLWSRPIGQFQGLWFSWKDVFVIDDLVWTWSPERGYRNNPAAVNGYDLKTGKLNKQVPVGNIFNVDHHHRCYRNKATLRYIIASRRGAEFVDLQEGKHTVHNWVRGTCHLGMMPANGLLYKPPDPCKCYLNEKLSGFCALAPAFSTNGPPDTFSGRPRMERGPAYGKRDGARAGPHDWTTFRADPARSGSTSAQVPSDLVHRWNVDLGGKLSAPVVIGDKLFVAAVDAHTIHALDAASGRHLWEYTAGGRIDSPPTYYHGTLLFGSADGRVTCVRASDGLLAWRFRAAPRERLIGACGQIESAWPVHGSVLVHNGIVYFAAGRSSYFDRGIELYGLDPITGKTLYHTSLKGPHVDLSDEGWYTQYKAAWGPGFLADILQVSDPFICMRNKTFDYELDDGGATGRVHAMGGFLDNTYFQRAYWYYGASLDGSSYQEQARPRITESQISIALSQLLVHDESTVYGIRMFDSMKLLNAQNYFVPGKKGYLLFAAGKGKNTHTWSCRVPIRVNAMVASPGQLTIAGPPDTVDPEDPLGAFEDREGGVLWTVSADNGNKLAEYKLDSPPVFNGMVAANGRLHLSLKGGNVLCLASK